MLEFADGAVGWKPPAVEVTSYQLMAFYRDDRNKITGIQTDVVQADQAWLLLWESFNLVKGVQYYFQVCMIIVLTCFVLGAASIIVASRNSVT